MVIDNVTFQTFPNKEASGLLFSTLAKAWENAQPLCFDFLMIIIRKIRDAPDEKD